ncbi:MAG: RNA polymerase sigma-70 factor [Balneolaceae bacterium]|nr:RNA polymerase sigma-70 factor [Balneolaceae bacterium]
MILPSTAQFILLALATSGSSDLDDAELARRIRQGDHEAFRRFFEAHHEALFRFLMSKGIAESTAEDLIQQAFVLIWEKRDGIDPAKSLRAYLFRIAYTRMLNHIRDHSKFDTEESVPHSETRQTPEDFAQHGELTEAVEDAVRSMPEKRRMVFDFCFMQGFTYREAAESLDISVKTVENHMGLALKDIRSALEAFRDI